MKKIIFLSVMLSLMCSLFAQETVTLTFTGKQESTPFQKLDSVQIKNLSKGWTEVIYYPDTLLILNTVGISRWESQNGATTLFQNTPNPFEGTTDFKLILTHKDKVRFAIYDINGKEIADFQRTLTAGEYQFRASMGTPQTYILNVNTKDGNAAIKMINVGQTGEQCRIEYLNSLPLDEDLSRKLSSYQFAGGDRMQYTGYTTLSNGATYISLSQVQNSDETITFVFPDDNPMAVIPTVQTLTVDRASGGTAEVTSKIVSDGGSPVIEAGVIIGIDSLLTGQVLTFKGGDIAPTGLYTTAATQLTSDIKYTKFYVRAFARNIAGTAYGDILSFIVNKDFRCGEKVYDIENNAYPTVQIGTQCWMAENLRTKSLPDGTPLMPITTNAEYVYGRYYYEHSDPAIGTEIYYPWSTACNWSKANLNQEAVLPGICPEGWHIPTYREFATMGKTVDPQWNSGPENLSSTGSNALPSNNKLSIKLALPNACWTAYAGPGFSGDSTISAAANTPGYNYHNHINDPDANSTGLSIKPCGYWKAGNFYFNGAAHIWTAIGTAITSKNTQVGRAISITHNQTGMNNFMWGTTAREAYSVRCVYGTCDPIIPVYPELEDQNSFSMIFLSDPQSYTKFALNQPIFELQTAWTSAMRNRLKVLTALISGDFVEQNDKDNPFVNGKIDASAQNQLDLRNGDQSSTQQWESVSHALNNLDNVLPYVTCQGNHDCGPLAAEDRTSRQPEYIYPERNVLNEMHIVSLCPNYEGKKTMESSAYEFKTETWGDLLIIGFEFAPRDEALNWAKQLIESDQYKNHRVIIFTHSFLQEDGTQYESEGYTLQPRNWAKDVWTKLIYPSKNIVLVLCGHAGSPTKMGSTVSATDYSTTCSFRTDPAADGRIIPQMMFNAQCADGNWYGNGGDGWLRILEFKPDGTTISVRTFSPLFALSKLTQTQAWRTKDYDQFNITVPKLNIK